MCRAQRGDLDAFSSLVEAHWRRLVGFARSLVGDGEAEDAVQDGFVIAWDKLGGLREPAAFGSWMLRLVGRLCLRRVRGRRRTLSLETLPEPPAATVEDPATQLHVEQLLAMLAPRQRAVMHLTAVEGMSDSEIGATLSIDAASVRSHRRRARQRLRVVLEGSSGNGGR